MIDASTRRPGRMGTPCVGPYVRRGDREHADPIRADVTALTTHTVACGGLHGTADMVALLLEVGADTSLEDGSTALDGAAAPGTPASRGSSAGQGQLRPNSTTIRSGRRGVRNSYGPTTVDVSGLYPGNRRPADQGRPSGARPRAPKRVCDSTRGAARAPGGHRDVGVEVGFEQQCLRRAGRDGDGRGDDVPPHASSIVIATHGPHRDPSSAVRPPGSC